jgi:hypothetical protein
MDKAYRCSEVIDITFVEITIKLKINSWKMSRKRDSLCRDRINLLGR